MLFAEDGGFFELSSGKKTGDFERWRRGRAVPDLLSTCSDFECEPRYVAHFLSFSFLASSTTHGSSSIRSGRLSDFTSINFFIRFPPFFLLRVVSFFGIHGSEGTYTKQLVLRLFVLARSSSRKLPPAPSGELSLMSAFVSLWLLCKTSSKSSAGDTFSDTTLCSSDTVIACWCFTGGRGDKDFVVRSCFAGFDSVREFDFSRVRVGGGESNFVGLSSCFFCNLPDEGRSLGLNSRFWFFGESSTRRGLVWASFKLLLTLISSFMLHLSQSSSSRLSISSLQLQLRWRVGDLLLPFCWCCHLVSFV